MQARPLSTYALPFLALWVRLELAKAYWIKGDRSSPATRDGRYFAPSARSLCSGRAGRGVSPDRRIERAAGIGRRVPSTPSRSRICRCISLLARSGTGCSSPATPSTRSAPSIENWPSHHAETRCNITCACKNKCVLGTATAQVNVLALVPKRTWSPPYSGRSLPNPTPPPLPPPGTASATSSPQPAGTGQQRDQTPNPRGRHLSERARCHPPRRRHLDRHARRMAGQRAPQPIRRLHGPTQNQPAIMRQSPQSQQATRHRGSLESPPRQGLNL